MARAYSYQVIDGPSTLAVPLKTFQQHLKRRSSSEDPLLKIYLSAAINYAENLTRRCLLNRTIRTFRDFFPSACQNEGYYPGGFIPSAAGGFAGGLESNVGFELRRSKLQSIVQIDYTDVDGNVVIIDPAEYYATSEDDYSEVLAVNAWPTNVARRMQAVRIDFIAGFGATPKSIPEDYVTSILQHATSFRANRGDCSDTACAAAVPAASKMFYLQNRIENL